MPATIVFFLCFSTAVLAAQKPELWPKWLGHNSHSEIRVDHKGWDRFLKLYIVTDEPSGINRVRYARVTPEDKENLKEYLKGLQSVQVSGLNRDEQEAYWINLYNALTVKVVLDHYPVKSIRDIDISPGWFKHGPWDAKLVQIEGEGMTLNDIEHRILRPIWKDNRIHYAVNCASLGCPNLQPEAFTGENTQTLLEKAAREYANHPRGLRIEGNRLTLSKIYKWFQVDFGGSEDKVIQHLMQYVKAPLAKTLRDFRGRINYEYDWDLNE
jgi:hypothetical protein